MTSDDKTTAEVLRETLAAVERGDVIGLAIVVATKVGPHEGGGVRTALERFGCIAEGLSAESQTILVAGMIGELDDVQDALAGLQGGTKATVLQ